MTATVVASATTRRSGVVSLAKGPVPASTGDTFLIDGVELSKTSGKIHVWGVGSGGVNLFGGIFHWIKGETTGLIGDEEGALPVGMTGGNASDITTVGLNTSTTYKKAAGPTASLGVYFDTDKLYLQNGNGSAGEAILVCWDVLIITH